MNREIKRALAKVSQARKALSTVVEDVQSKCQHKHVAECEYQPSQYGNAFVPVRICLDCGVTEDGWGIGFVVLRPKRVVKIDRDELYALRIGKHYDEEGKCRFKGYLT